MAYVGGGWSSISDPAPIAATKNGWVQGFCRNGNAVFLGIPYGGRCDGEYRFREAGPAPKWNGVRDCTKYGAIAMQRRMDESAVPEKYRKTLRDYDAVFSGGQHFNKFQERPNENCLYLNVVTPGLDAKGRAVLVYIHGGGYTKGSGGVVSTICDRLIDEENLVIVTVNHRLNVFGSLYLGEFDADYAESGIVTQLDLLHALRWIRDNIEAFGGSPERVTLIGESGGGMKIHHLLAMPESRGLFARAIIMSGSVPPAVKTRDQGTAEALAVMEKLGIQERDWRKLLRIPADGLLSATSGMGLILPETTPFVPTPDGVRMPINRDGGFRVNGQMWDVPVIIGSAEEELATSFLRPELTWEELRRELLTRKKAMMCVVSGITEENVDKLIEVFHSRDRKKEPWQVLIQIVSTAHFLGGGSYLAALAQCGEGGRVWHYSTAFDTPIPGEEKLACAWHGADQPLTFRAVYYKKAEPVSEFMAHSFAAFAKTGNPETENIKWPSFDRKRRETMIFDVKTKWEEDPYRDIYRAVAQVSPSFTRMMSGVEWIESPRCKKQEGVS